MKTLVLVLLLAAAFPSPGAGPDREVVDQCPYGHKTLKYIPILYGLPPSSGPALKKAREDVAAEKYVYGDDNLPPDAPKFQPKCTTCGFEYLQSTFLIPGFWDRNSADPKSFKAPFTDFITTFPTPPPKRLRGQINYSQSLDDKLNVELEGISYISAEPLDPLRAKVEAWLQLRQLKIDRQVVHHKASETRDGHAEDIVLWKSLRTLTNSSPVEITLIFRHKEGRCHVYLLHTIAK